MQREKKSWEKNCTDRILFSFFIIIFCNFLRLEDKKCNVQMYDGCSTKSVNDS